MVSGQLLSARKRAQMLPGDGSDGGQAFRLAFVTVITGLKGSDDDCAPRTAIVAGAC